MERGDRVIYALKLVSVLIVLQEEDEKELDCSDFRK